MGSEMCIRDRLNEEYKSHRNELIRYTADEINDFLDEKGFKNKIFIREELLTNRSDEDK